MGDVGEDALEELDGAEDVGARGEVACVLLEGGWRVEYPDGSLRFRLLFSGHGEFIVTFVVVWCGMVMLFGEWW